MCPSDNGPSWNPFDHDFLLNPYTVYERLRDEDPVHRTPFGVLVVSRYEDVNRVLRDSKTSVQRFTISDELPPHIQKWRNLSEERPPSILGLDPPDHTRLRGLVQRTFTPRAIEKMREQVISIVDELLTKLKDRKEIDVITDYAFVIPFAVIHEMLGLPETDISMVRSWSHALTQTLEPFLTPEEVEAAIEGAENMNMYLQEAITSKRKNPREDLLSQLIEVEEAGDQMTDEELLSMVSLLFIAGHETTVNLIGNGIHALLEHPDELQRVRTGRAAESQIVDELLRWDSPVQTSGRRLLYDTEIAGIQIAANETVLTALGSANHDPRFWGDNADQLDITRSDAARHMSFGSGIHHCLGASLARMEGEIAITKLVREFGDLELSSEPTLNARIILRGRETLPICLNTTRS